MGSERKTVSTWMPIIGIVILLVGGAYIASTMGIFGTGQAQSAVPVPSGTEGQYATPVVNVGCDLDVVQKSQIHSNVDPTGVALASTTTDVYLVAADGSLTSVQADRAPDADQTTAPNSNYKFYTEKGNYFSRWWDGTTDCIASDDFVVSLAGVDGSVTGNLIDSRNGNVNADSTNELTFTGAGQNRLLTVNLLGGTAQEYLTDPKYNTVTVVLDVVVSTDLDYTQTQLSGCTRTAVPINYAGTGDIAWVCENTQVFNFGQNNAHLLNIQASSTAYPEASEDMYLHIMPHGDTKNSITGAPMLNVCENDAGTAVQIPTKLTIYA